MKYIKELREGENVIEHYLCKSRASMKSRNGKTYLSLKLQDKTGIVDAKVWDMNKDIQSFQENDFIKVDAFVTTFNNELQLNVKRIRRSREGEYDPADFIPSTDKNIDEMYTQLLAYIKTIQSPYIKKLLEEIFLRHPVISKDRRSTSRFFSRASSASRRSSLTALPGTNHGPPSISTVISSADAAKGVPPVLARLRCRLSVGSVRAGCGSASP